VNKAQRAAWRTATGTLVVASLCCAQPAPAQTVALPVLDPTVNDDQVGAVIVSNGDTVTLEGPATNIAQGTTGVVTRTLPDLYADGLTTDPRANPADPASLVVNRGTRSQVITVPDPIGGGTRTVAVYDNVNIVDTFASSVAQIYSAPVNGPTGGRQYINARIGGVDASGGTLNVAIGSATTPTNIAVNNIDLGMAKQTSLFHADGTGTAASTIVWQGVNRVNMGSVTGTVTSAGPGLVQTPNTYSFYAYTGTFTAFDGSTRTVRSAADLQAYNTFLIAQLRSGALDPGQYETQFSRAFTATSTTIAYINGPPLPDEAYLPIGVRAVIQANGANARGIIAAGARLDVFSVGNPASAGAIINGGMLATNGGTVINQGQLSAMRGGNNDRIAAMVINTGSHGENSGIINIPFLSGLQGAVNPTMPSVITGTGSAGVAVQDAGSTFANAAGGVINVGTGGSAGLQLTNSATGTNAGTINVGVTALSASTGGSNIRTDGVLVNTGGSFTNLPGGVLYLGRQPQYVDGQVVPDIPSNVTPLSGISVQNTGSATNAGTIMFGTLVQGGVGINVSGGNAGVTNSGVININGAASDNPTENVGINVVNSQNVTNTGTINVNGINGIGLKLSGTGSSRGVSSGTINVNGGVSTTGLRNYGIWSEAAPSIATLSGTITLTGEGAIGVHARSAGSVIITGSGAVVFNSGSNQIGYFLFGPGSTINNGGTAPQVVSTPRSVLFRIEDGAVFTGGTGGSLFTASGQGTSVFDITGAPSTFSSGNMTLNLSGGDARGVVIEGGATGNIAATATINQTGVGSIAGIVDGQKYDLAGAPVGVPNPLTSLVSAATLNSALDGVTGYIARNRGQLTNSGNVVFTGAHTIGLFADSGATATNSANISISNGGIGIAAKGAAGALPTVINNSGTILVNGGSTSDRSRGVVAEGPQATANMQSGSRLDLVGVGAIGAEALAGGRVTVAGTATPVFGNSDQIAYHALGAGSAVSSSATALDAAGVRSTLFRIEDGATLTTSTALTASGPLSVAVDATGPGAQAQLSGSTLAVTGDGARGLVVEGGASGILAADVAVNLTGNAAVVGVADGQKHDLAGNPVGQPDAATRLTNQSAITVAGPNALGFIVQNQATLANQAPLAMTGTGATGVDVRDGGILDNQADIRVSSGTGVSLQGSGSQLRNAATITADDGVAALHVHDGGGSAVAGNLIAAGSAHAVLMGTGATALTLTDAVLASNGAGNGLENTAETAAISLHGSTINVQRSAGIRTGVSLDPDSAVTVNVGGDGIGIAFQTAAGAITSNALDLGAGYVVNGIGDGATGIFANTSSTVDSDASVFIHAAAGGPALLAGSAQVSRNRGALRSQSVVSPVVDLSNGSGSAFINEGAVLAASATGVAINGSAGVDNIDLERGQVVGRVVSGAGDDIVQWNGGTLEGAIETGDGDDLLSVRGVDLSGTSHLEGGAGEDMLLLTDVDARGGSFAGDDPTLGVNLGQAWETVTLDGATHFTLSGNLVLGGSTLNIEPGSTLFAGAGVHPTIGTPGVGSAVVNNAGVIDLTNGSTGPTDTLTINGDYVGQGGRLRLETLTNEGGPNSTSDRLVAGSSLIGAAATGIEVVYSDANGPPTVGDGILLVDVAGPSTAGAFVLANRVVGGAYEYLLFHGGLAAGGGNPQDGNWYLRNVSEDPVPPDPPDPPQPPDPPGPPDPPPPPTPDPDPPVPPQPPEPPPPPEPPQPPVPEPEPPPPPEPERPVIPILRPETAVYLANQAAAIGMFNHTLHDRLGEVDYLERQRAAGGPVNGAWARVYRSQFSTSAGQFNQVDASTDVNVLQMGAERNSWSAGDQRLSWGLMAGYGESRTDAVSHISGYSARGRIDGYSAGAYATWFQTASQPTGAYLDAWLLYGDYRETVHGDALPRERYDSSTWTGSLEGGYAFELAQGARGSWFLEPQAQVLYTDYAGGDHREVNGTRERPEDAGGTTTRVGARLYRRPAGTVFNRVQPFLEVNWWHVGTGSSIAFDNRVESLNHGKDSYEYKAGFQIELGSGWTGWGQMGIRDASGDYRNVEGLIGAKYNW